MTSEKPGSLSQETTVPTREARKERPAFSPDLVLQGDAYEALYGAEHAYLPDDHVVVQEVQALLEAYPGSDKPARVRVSFDASSPNAFVLPNGTIIVNRGLLGLVDTQELQVVIAHEVTHYRRRDVQEFTKLQDELIGGRRQLKKRIGLIGSMRTAEMRADIQGIVEGDEAGTHPAALRTLMLKFEQWEKDHSQGPTESDLVHGREIDRIVNAGMAAQVYDFSAEYQKRIPLSPETQAFSKTEPLQRFPDSPEDEGTEMAFKAASPLEVLSCVRRWRDQDRALAAELKEKELQRLSRQYYNHDANTDGNVKQKMEDLKQKGIEVPIVGEGYAAALTQLETHITNKLPEASPLQQKALAHFLFDSAATIAEDELVESPIEHLTEYLGDIEDQEAMEEARAILTPVTLETLGVFLPDGKGLARFSGALLRTANEASLYEEKKRFNVDAYLEESSQLLQTTTELLETRSLSGKKGFALSEPMLDELLLNIDTKESCRPAVDALLQFQQSLIQAGLPPEAARLYKAIQRQHYYQKLSKELESEDKKSHTLYKGAFLEQEMFIHLFGGLHPFFKEVRIDLYGHYGNVELFDEMALYEIAAEEEGLDQKEVEKALFKDGAWQSRLLACFRPLSEDVRHIELSENSAFERKTRRAVAQALAREMYFPEVLTSLSAVGDMCAALNRLEDEVTKEPHVRKANFSSILTLAFAYLLGRVGKVDWLPMSCDEAALQIVRVMARHPGHAVSNFLIASDVLSALRDFSPVEKQLDAMTHLVKTILNDDRAEKRSPEIHLDYVYEKGDRDLAKPVYDDHITRLFNVIKDSFRAPKKEVFAEQLEAFHALIFRYRKVVPLSSIDYQNGTTSNPDENFCYSFIGEYVQDLDRPVDRKILLSLMSHVYDPVVRGRTVKEVIDRELAIGKLTPKEMIDLLWKNGHVRSVTLDETRAQVIDEKITAPEDLAYLRSLVLEQGDQDLSNESVGVYALVEKLEKKKDAFEFFRIAYEYSLDDTAAKRETFLIVRQDWEELSVVYTDELALVRTEALMQNLEASDELVRHALVRKLLIGEKGLLHTSENRKKLFDYLLVSGVDTAQASRDLFQVTKEVLETAAQVVETDVLFAALAPFLQERLFKPAQKHADWLPILTEIYNNKKMANETLKDVALLRQFQVTEDDDETDGILVPVDQKIQTRLRALGIDLDPTVQAQPLPTLETMIVRVAESLGALGARFLQVAGQYIENLSPELEAAFRDAHDNVRGQPKLTARETLQKRAPNLHVTWMGKRLGGGSLMSPYACEVQEGDAPPRAEAVKVLAPNAEFLLELVETNVFKVVDELVAKDPKRYAPAKMALQDISHWIRADINDRRFFDLDPTFREQYSGFRVPGMHYGLYIPESYPVEGDPKAPANKQIKREELIPGVTLNRLFADPKEPSLKDAVSLIAKSFAQQLVGGVMHSDIHPGNYMAFQKEQLEWLAMIDRSYYLELDDQDRTLILNLTQEAATAEDQAKTVKTYFSKDSIAKDLGDDFWIDLAQNIQTEGERGLHQAMAILRGRGVEVDFKLTLLLKNMSSINRMCQRAGFASFREALGYLPEPV